MSVLSQNVKISESIEPTTAPFQDAVVILNSTGEIVDWNQYAEKLYGWKKEEVVEKIFVHLLDTRVLGKGLNFSDLLDIHLTKNINWRGKLIHTNKYGQRIITQTNVHLFHFSRTSASHFIIVSEQTFLNTAGSRENTHQIRQTDSYFVEDFLTYLISDGGLINDMATLQSFVLEGFIQYYSLDAGILYAKEQFQDELTLLQSELLPQQMQESLEKYPSQLFPVLDVLTEQSAVFADSIQKKLPSTHPLCLFESLMAVPISVGTELLGVFIGLNKKSQIPQSENPGSIELISQQIGLLINRLQEKARYSQLTDEIELYIQKRTYDLTIANQQLKKYASHIAHDLREPARMVFAYLELFHMKASTDIPADALEFLHYALDGAERMKALLEGIWEYTKITSQDRNHVAIDTMSLLEKVCAQLSSILSDTQTQIRYENLPDIEGDKVLLFQLLHTLIQKIILFSYNECLSIEIKVKQSNRFWSFRIIKKGKKLPQDQIQRIEQVFSRGYHIKALPTLDLDLSICKGIVEKHGGIIGIESDPKQETVIYFTIKKYEEIQKRMMEVKSV